MKPRFLLDPTSGPFIQASVSELGIAFSCISQINQSLDLIKPTSSPDDIVGVAQGLHGALPYAFNHWASHFLDFLDGRDSAALMNQVSEFCGRLRKVHCPEGQPESIDIADERDRRLSKLGSMEEVWVIYDMIRKTREKPNHSKFQVFISTYLDTSTADTSQGTNHNATNSQPLAQAMARYLSLVKSLMERTHVTGLSQPELIAFKEAFGPTAFVCSYYGCDHATLGFPTKSQLEAHQVHHEQPLRCYEEGCVYNDVGFPTSRSLQTHKRKQHRSVEVNRVPKRLRLSQQSMPDPSITVPNDVGTYKSTLNSRELEEAMSQARLRFQQQSKRGIFSTGLSTRP